MNEALFVPAFPRLGDYLGLWLHEPGRFLAQWQLIQREDIRAHMAERRPEITSALTTVPGRGGKNVGIIRMSGLLMKGQSSLGGTSTVQLRRDIRQAVSDPGISGILLSIDSPGGTAPGTADLAAEVRAATRKKPVWAHIDDMGASAAYFVASQANVIYANEPSALVGSIGTVQVVVDSSAKAEKEGVKVHVISTGPMKGAGMPGAPVTDEQLAHVQSLVDGMQTGFDEAVKSGRGITSAELANVRTGAVFLARDARGLKLIDGIKSLDQTLSALAAER